ncbi:hypothetical protein BD310DRAFT_942739 [Dichomitus squalens]|uniref:Uncharacterized protein n=1 Tax=Dichomitus squalens TaxID=114155 RepID=A0A4Q9PAW7_9APHY|nr:hypothetical protein BD310DRAFT_942739 [Dichomitus squalens]
MTLIRNDHRCYPIRSIKGSFSVDNHLKACGASNVVRSETKRAAAKPHLAIVFALGRSCRVFSLAMLRETSLETY